MRIRTAFEIQETAEELRRLLTKESDGRKRERVHFLYLFKSGQVTYLSQAAEVLGRSRKTLSQWRTKYLDGGLVGVLDRGASPGRTPQVRGEALAKLEERLSDPKGFGSYKEIGGWMREEVGIVLPPKTLYHLCHYKLGATSKVVRPRNPKQEKDAVEGFKKTSAPTWRPGAPKLSPPRR